MISKCPSSFVALCALGVVLATVGCKDKSASSATPAAADAAPTDADPNAAASSEAGTSIAAARTDLKAGKVDDAAAKLAALQMQRATFSTAQAKDYRQALSDAYDQAIEAAQKGDPKARAAIDLLRSAAPR